jgi:hypothetical protein
MMAFQFVIMTFQFIKMVFHFIRKVFQFSILFPIFQDCFQFFNIVSNFSRLFPIFQVRFPIFQVRKKKLFSGSYKLSPTSARPIPADSTQPNIDRKIPLMLHCDDVNNGTLNDFK